MILLEFTVRESVGQISHSHNICLQHGKSVIPFTHFYGNKKAYWIQKSGKLTHRDILRKDIDEAIANSSTVKEFEYCLKNLGYRFERDFYYEHPSVIADRWQRSVRTSSLGKDYTKDRIVERCRENRSGFVVNTIYNAPYKRKPLLVIEYKMQELERMDSVQVVFALFIELLKICSGNNIEQQHNRPLSPQMRAEVQKLDKYIEEYTLLCDNNIQSPKELLLFQENLSNKITALEKERYAIQLKIRRAKTPEEDAVLKERAKEITQKLTPLRAKLKIAQRTEEYIPKIKELLDNERATEMKRNNLTKKKERAKER